MRVDFNAADIGDTLTAIARRTSMPKHDMATLLRAVVYVDPAEGCPKPANFPVPAIYTEMHWVDNDKPTRSIFNMTIEEIASSEIYNVGE